MATSSDDDFPSAKECMKTIAVAEAEKASEYMRRQSAAEAEKRALMERFEKPSGVSDEERLKRAKAIIQWAVNNGLTEVQVIRFRTPICTVGACHQSSRLAGKHAPRLPKSSPFGPQLRPPGIPLAIDYPFPEWHAGTSAWRELSVSWESGLRGR